MTLIVGSSSSDSLDGVSRRLFRDWRTTFTLATFSSSSKLLESSNSLSEPSNMPCAVLPTGMPMRIPLFVSAANSSSLEESGSSFLTTVLGVRLVDVDDDCVAREKSIFVCRLRSRTFLGAILASCLTEKILLSHPPPVFVIRASVASNMGVAKTLLFVLRSVATTPQEIVNTLWLSESGQQWSKMAARFNVALCYTEGGVQAEGLQRFGACREGARARVLAS